MNSLTKTLAGTVAGGALAASAFAQSARDVRNSTPTIDIVDGNRQLSSGQSKTVTFTVANTAQLY